MTSINPLYIFEIVKQKVDWGTILTPVNKIHDTLETFNSTDNKTLILNGKDLSENIPECKDVVEEKDTFKNLDLGKDIKVILANLSNACIVKDMDGTQKIRIEMNLLGSDKRITDLIKPTSSEMEIMESFKDAPTKARKYGYVNIGKSELSAEKKDILGLIGALLTQEYEKSSTKDGKLTQETKGEIAIISSEKQKFVELLDMTGVKNNPSLCDVSDIQITNIISVTNIKKIRVLDEGKNYCIDLHTSKSYQQSRVLTVNTTEPSKTKGKLLREMNGNGESMDGQENETTNGESADVSLKKSVLDSYIANYLSSVYKDKEKWTIEWMRLTDTSILIKIKSKDENELIFHKFDVTDAVVENGSCPEYKIEPKVREFIYFQEFCKKNSQYKLKYGLIGTQHSMIVGLKIAFAKLVEAKSQQELENFQRNLGKFDKASVYSTVLPYYNTFSGLYNLGLYNSGVYTYPFSYAGVTPYYGTYYVPPVASSIVPTAPVVSPVPYTYTYPPITSMYSLGSYYAPYTYSYMTPFTYSYATPYTYTYYVKSEIPATIGDSERVYRRLVQTEVDEFDKFRNVKYVVPAKVSNIRELSNRLVGDNMKSINIEKISNYLYKVEFEKHCIKQTHYYSFENDGLYHVTPNINKRLI